MPWTRAAAVLGVTGVDFGVRRVGRRRGVWGGCAVIAVLALGALCSGLDVLADTPAVMSGAVRATITGRVLESPGGEPVAGAEVNVWWSTGPAARTNDDGVYTITGLEPGEYSVRVESAPGRPEGTWCPSVVVNVADRPVRADDLCLTLPQSLGGTVRDTETGKPVAGARINFSTGRTRNRNGIQTDSNGQYRLYVDPRKVSLYSVGTRDRWIPVDFTARHGDEREVQVGPGQQVRDVDFTVRSAPPYEGRVLMPDGRSAAGAAVSMTISWHGDGPGGWRDGMGSGRTHRLTTDAEGRFTGYLRRPMYADWDETIKVCAIARTDDGALAAVAFANASTTDPRVDAMELRLVPTGAAEFNVVDTAGTPVSGAKVRFRGRHGASGTRSRGGWLDYSRAPLGLESLGGGRYRATGLVSGFKYEFATGVRNVQWSRPSVLIASGETLDAGTLTGDWCDELSVTTLIEQLRSEKDAERRLACRVLRHRGAAAADAVGALIDLVRSHRSAPRASLAAEALGAMGEAARPAVPDLIGRLEDGGIEMQIESAEALGLIGDPSALPALRRARASDVGGDAKIRAYGEGARRHVAEAIRRLEAVAGPNRVNAPEALGRLDDERAVRASDGFVYIRYARVGTEAGGRGHLQIDAAVLVTLSEDAPAGLEIEEIPLEGLNHSAHPMAISGKTLYFTYSGDLLALDLTTGQLALAAQEARDAVALGGRIYYESASGSLALDTRTRTLARSIARPVRGLRVSPDGKHLAWTERHQMDLHMAKVMDVATTAVITSTPIEWRVPDMSNNLGQHPPLMWLDDARLLTLRTEPEPQRPLSEGDYLVVIDTGTGEGADLVRIPGAKDRVTLHHVPGTGPVVIASPSTTGVISYRLAIKQRELVDAPIPLGPAVAHHLSSVLDGNVIIAKELSFRNAHVADHAAVVVAPDASRLVYWTRGSRGLADLYYLDESTKAPRRVATLGGVSGLIWFTLDDLKPAVRLAKLPDGATPLELEPYPKPPPEAVVKRAALPDVSTGLLLSAATDREAYSLHEPVVLTLALKNISAQDLEVAGLKLMRGSVTAHYNSETGQYSGGKLLDNYGVDNVPPKVNLEPGQSISEAFPLEPGRPGRYTIDHLEYGGYPTDQFSGRFLAVRGGSQISRDCRHAAVGGARRASLRSTR
ncbi:MAG: hypothetical protein CMJ49_09875, partial [Planctomycetaceae bacterium]|nr:hypothetical protein [Planctomycetaceae bacterium]